LSELKGKSYNAALQEIRDRGLEIVAMKKRHPERTLKDCDAAVCFKGDA